MGGLPILFAYVGPDVTLPVASVLAGIFGFIMMVGRAPLRFAANRLRALKVRLGFRPSPPRVASGARAAAPPEDSPSAPPE
jgi:hypothetical protein